MPYTTQGFMTHDDIRDWEESTDNGSITIDTADPPAWFDMARTCPLDGMPFGFHEWVTVGRASGEPWTCDFQ